MIRSMIDLIKQKQEYSERCHADTVNERPPAGCTEYDGASDLSAVEFSHCRCLYKNQGAAAIQINTRTQTLPACRL